MEHGDAVHLSDVLVGDESVVLPAGLGARDTLRLEAGLCLYGNDIDETTSPIEGSLMWTVGKARRDENHPNKFPGFDRIMREINEKTWTRKRVGIQLDAKRPPKPGSEVLKDGQVVGRVTSGTVSPILNKGIGMAYLDRPNHLRKTEGLYLDVRGKKLDLKVTPMPFVPTSYYEVP